MAEVKRRKVKRLFIFKHIEDDMPVHSIKHNTAQQFIADVEYYIKKIL